MFRLVTWSAAFLTCSMLIANAELQAAEKEEKAASSIPEGMKGFRGMLKGKLVSKDVEKGKLELEVESVLKQWPKSTAKDAPSAVGKTVPINGVFGKWLDVLLQVDKGQKIEIEAFHNGGDTLTFPGEWLKKVE
jgi:hypothetical protein